MASAASLMIALPRAATVVVAGLVLASCVEGNTFLARESPALTDDRDLLGDLVPVLGGDRAARVEGRVALLEDALRPTFQAFLHSLRGLLDSGAVRYLLHRLFVDRHGWFVRGLDGNGDAWNSSSVALVFKQHAGEDVHSVFEEHSQAGGFNLRDVAILAATLESFVHQESMERLEAAYRLAHAPKDGRVTEGQAVLAIESYMITYVLGSNMTEMSEKEVLTSRAAISDAYPNWEETRKWVHQVRDEVLGASKGSDRTSFAASMRVVEEIADRYGRWQDRECHDIKDSLVKLEHAQSGRVLLAKFYASALGGNWQFSESRDYLRQLGALDDSDPRRPSVMIPNYVNSPSNCVASSKFYSVCCINECEAILGHLERHLSSPSASPARLIELVSALPSATTLAPRALPEPLPRRLEEIAAQHGGEVPLHGRLFAQWLHHAYPRECPFPHLSGTSKPTTPEQWSRETGQEIVADAETMRWHIAEAGAAKVNTSKVVMDNELPWSVEEELFVTRPAAPEPDMTGQVASVGRGIMMIALACSMSLTLMRMATEASEVAQKYSI